MRTFAEFITLLALACSTTSASALPPEGPASPSTYIQLLPPSGAYQVGDTITITVDASTGGNPARGVGMLILYDPAILQLNPDSLIGDPGSAYQLFTSGPYEPGRLDLPFVEPNFELIAYTGPLVSFQLVAIAGAPATNIIFEERYSRFGPALPNTTLTGATFAVDGPTPTPTEIPTSTPSPTPTVQTPSPTPTPVLTPTLTPNASVTPSPTLGVPPATAEVILETLLGYGVVDGGQDLNDDGAVDVADVLDYLIPR